jgi:hypothetical protein
MFIYLTDTFIVARNPAKCLGLESSNMIRPVVSPLSLSLPPSLASLPLSPDSKQDLSLIGILLRRRNLIGFFASNFYIE